MFITSKRIPANLIAKLEGKTRIPYEGMVFDIVRAKGKIGIVYQNPTFVPSMFAQANNRVTTVTLKPCRLFKGSFKVSQAFADIESGLRAFAGVIRRVKESKRDTAEWLRKVFEELKYFSLSANTIEGRRSLL